MLRWAIYAVVGLVGVAGIIAIVGWSLPVAHTASSTVTIDAPPERVFDAIADVARAAEWRTGVSRIEVLPDDGKGLRFREHNSMGTMLMRVEASERPRRFVTRIADP